MADIVERLENWGKIYPEEDQDEEEGTLYIKAAAEIKRLRDELYEVKSEMELWIQEESQRDT